MKTLALFGLLVSLLIFNSDQYSPRQLSVRENGQIDSVQIFKSGLFAPATVNAFYRKNRYEYAWTEPSRTSDSLLVTLRNARFYGLSSTEYHLSRIEALLDASDSLNTQLLDILLTDAYVRFAFNLKHGRLHPHSHAPIASLSAIDTSLIVLLENTLQTGNISFSLRQFEPRQRDYQKLKDRLREKLVERDQLFLSNERKEFLQADVLKLCINLERWRWEEPFPQRYLFVNIPSYNLQVIDGEKVVLRSKVIVGLSTKPTPVLTSDITSIVLYPFWDVPRAIATNEILPKLKKDPSYLTRHNFVVLDLQGKPVDPSSLNWEQYNHTHFPFRLRQTEGDDNTLGIIKFKFSNPYQVSLHDTNDRTLFNKDYRALSHGCVRIQKATELAHYLVNFDHLEIEAGSLTQALINQKRMEIKLHTPLPIMFRYFTADKDTTYPDVYSIDAPLLRAFASHMNYESPVPFRNDFTALGNEFVVRARASLGSE